MSEAVLNQFYHGHAAHDEQVTGDLKKATSLNDFAEKLVSHGKAKGHDFHVDHVKDTVKKEHKLLHLLKSKGVTDEELQSVAGGSTIVVCIGGAMIAGSVAEGSADQIEDGEWKI
jgi:hypothetical protein